MSKWRDRTVSLNCPSGGLTVSGGSKPSSHFGGYDLIPNGTKGTILHAPRGHYTVAIDGWGVYTICREWVHVED